MSRFKNMKIAITPEQPLDEIVEELDRLGYKDGSRFNGKYVGSLVVFVDLMTFADCFTAHCYVDTAVTIILSELKEILL